MSDNNGADTLKRISELEEQLDKRYNAIRNKTKDMVSQSRIEASRVIGLKNEELARVRDIDSEGSADYYGSKTGSTDISQGNEIDSKIVSKLADSLFRLLIERKRM